MLLLFVQGIISGIRIFGPVVSKSIQQTLGSLSQVQLYQFPHFGQ